MRERYGAMLNGMSLLLARRLVEVEVPFVTVYSQDNPKNSKCGDNGWDTHANNFGCLRERLLPEFDRVFFRPVGGSAHAACWGKR